MNTLHRTRAFVKWFRQLRDQQARDRIVNRTDRAEEGNFGDHHSLGDGISEMRIDYGSGYRIYFAQEGNAVYLLLLGGDKRHQESDIRKAKAMWQAMKGKQNENAD